MANLAVGASAPDFTADTDDGPITLSKLRGKSVVLYFYPKDNTPGCTVEACDFRDRHAAFAEEDVVVLGVSPDSVRSHQGFRAKFSLPFRLVADPDRRIAQAYGVFREKTMYGKKVLGIVRSTFVVDPAGKLAAIWDGVKVAGHVDAVLAAVSGGSPAPAKAPAKAAAKKAPAKKTATKKTAAKPAPAKKAATKKTAAKPPTKKAAARR